MKVKDFYLVKSVDTSKLDRLQKEFLDEQLTLFHKTISIIEKTEAIDKIANNRKLKDIRYLYNKWLFTFATEQLKTVALAEEKQHLQNILGNCFNVFGEMYYYKNDYNKALKNFTETLRNREKQDDKELLLATYLSLSMVYRKQGNLASALETYEKFTPLIKYIKDQYLLARYYVNIGIVFEQQGNYQMSLDYFYKALEIFDKNNFEMKEGSGIAYHNIGSSLARKGEFDTALKYYEKALKIYQRVEYMYGESSIYSDIGMIYERKKEEDTALKYYNEAIEIQKSLNLPERLSNTYLQIGSVYESRNQFNLAYEYYNKSLDLCEKIESKERHSRALSKTGPLEIKKGAIEKARTQIELAFDLARDIGDPLIIKNAVVAKIALAKATGDYKVAYEMERLKNEMKDKIQNEGVRKEIIKQQYKYENKKALSKKDLEIEVEKENARIIEEQSDLLELKNDELASKNEIINKQVKELEELIQKLQESNESLNQFAAVAAHDLKAPLRNIQGFSQLLYQKFTGQLPEQDMLLFRHIINSCTSLKELIDGLLNYSKISNIKLELGCVDLSELVADVENNLSNIIKETKIVLHIADGLPKVTGQYSLLFQVVLNFINNAIKFRRKEEGLQSEIWIDSEYHNNEIKISIKDNGIGIEKEHQDKIFGIFKKLHSSSEYEGSGIGLSVCKKIIERLGGKVWLASEKNVGTTFFFTLKQQSLLK